MATTVILGVGNVGKNLSIELACLSPELYDPFKDIDTRTRSSYDFAFIAVDTPYVNNDNPCDVSAVYEALNEVDASVYVIKSTVPIGFTSECSKATGKNIVFSPEYYGTTQHANNFNMVFTVLGGKRTICLQVQQLLQGVYDARHRFYIVDAKVAEMVKYMENAWIATKVDFCIGFYEACLREGIDYEIVRECFIADPRVSPCHTFVYADKPFWDSHCLNKDVPAVALQENITQLKQLIARNESRKARCETIKTDY